jgi:hypothetical protein
VTPERAAAIFRALLETPPQELVHFARRNGLEALPTPQDLAQAREMLQAIAVALNSNPGPNWERIATAWSAMRARHGELHIEAAGPKQPSWIQPAAPARPSLGDPAPGTTAHQQREEHRQRFVPPAPTGGAYAAPSPSPVPATPYHSPHPGYPAQAAPPHPHAAPSHPAASPPAPPVRPWGPPAYQQPSPSQPSLPVAQQPAYAAQAYAAQAYAAPQPAHHDQHGSPAQHAYAPPHHAAPAQPPQHPQPAQQAQPPSPPMGGQPGIETSVATYAAFCAACAAAPDRVAITMTQYGLGGSDARADLDDLWQDRFDDDPALHQQWERLFHQFRAQLR